MTNDMNVFFIRHGESVNNAANIRQGAEGDLTLLGRKQAAATGHRLAGTGIRFDHFLASPMPRAAQTAEIVAEAINMSHEYSELFVEHKNPSEIIGKPHDDPDVVAVNVAVRDHYTDPEWKYSDEESFVELRRRGRQALERLEELEGENVLVVTHAKFLRLLTAYIMHGEAVTPEQFWNIFLTLRNHNGGINMLAHEEERWRLVSWNDHTHLLARGLT